MQSGKRGESANSCRRRMQGPEGFVRRFLTPAEAGLGELKTWSALPRLSPGASVYRPLKRACRRLRSHLAVPRARSSAPKGRHMRATMSTNQPELVLAPRRE